MQLSPLVMRFSRMGERPDWRAEPPVRKPVMANRGNHPAWFITTEVEHKISFGCVVRIPVERATATIGRPSARCPEPIASTSTIRIRL